MKEPQRPTGTDPFAFPSLPLRSERTLPAKGSGNSLLLLQLRTELEGKWRPDKLGILRKWMNVSPKHWFCQKEDVNDYGSRSSKQCHASKHSRKKQKPRTPPSSQPPDDQGFRHGSFNEEVLSDKNERKARRFRLEEEVMILQKRLQGEVDLHAALESVMSPTSGACSRCPADIPLSTLELIEDIAMLEKAVAGLEDQSATLESLIQQERRERQSLEGRRNLLKCCCDHSSSLPETRRTKISLGAEENSECTRSYLKPRSPRTLGDYLARLSVVRAAQPATVCTHCGSGDPAYVSDVLTVAPAVKSSSMPRYNDAEDSSSLTASSDSGSKHNFLSAFDPHNRLQSSVAFLQDTLNSFPFSPTQYMYSGASTSEQSGSCGHSSGSGLQDLGSSSLGVSDYSLPSSPADTPEHRVRPSSPNGSTPACGSLRISNDDLSEDTYAKQIPKVFVKSSEDHSSTGWSYPTEEFHTPRTSSISADHLSGDSRSPSTEKRSKVCVQLDLQAADSMFNGRKTFTFDKSYDADNVTARRLICELLSPQKHVDTPPLGSPSGVDEKFQIRDFSQSPNLLSEEMIKCMISIYCHLADPAVILRNRSCYDTISSPTSHFGLAALSSFSSFSESSLLSFVRSPLVDLRSKDDILGCESSPDPYRVRGRIPWAEIGAYGKVLEVPWMSVSKDQLGYAAQALYRFRQLVEQLPSVDPQFMSHSEKLAFWINLYNSLMMHAYLAYGIPRTDLKYFALIQKAAYNIGGHSFSAATIEFSLLHGTTPSYRPQIGLLFALHRNKFNLTEEQKKFAIDYPEPQMAFALCCGARSSPAVRVYTAAQVHKELGQALQDYARAAVGLNTKGKLLIPKLLYTYACEIVEDSALLDWICQLLPSNQAGLVMECWQHRQARLLGARKFAVLPFEFNFRYLFSPFQPFW